MTINTVLPGALSRTEDVPAKLKRLTFWNWVLTILFCTFTMIGYGEHRYAVKTLEDSARSVFIAHQIKDNVLNMDANMVNYLIGKPGENYDAFRTYLQYRTDLADKQVAAAQDIDEGEKKPLMAIHEALGDYEAALQGARDRHEAGDEAYLASYRKALKILDTRIIPAAEALDKANSDLLETSYQHQSEGSWGTLALNALSGAALVGFLCYTQLYLRRRFGTRLSFVLSLGIVLAGGFTAYTTVAYIKDGHDLKVAKEAAYDSIIALMDARGSAYDAFAAQSRWLLDEPLRKDHVERFKMRVAQVADLRKDNGVTFASAEQEASQKASLSKATMDGALAKELNNITFPGERDAAVETLHWFGVWVGIDGQIRQFETSGHHDLAVALSIGTEKNQGKWAFTNFDNALERTLTINQDYFEKYVAAANRDIGPIWEIALAQSILQALLFILAMRPRMREYPV